MTISLKPGQSETVVDEAFIKMSPNERDIFFAAEYSSYRKRVSGQQDRPLPLRRNISRGEPFPIVALGATLGQAAKAIADIVQCAEGLASTSILAAASYAAQAQANVIIPATLQARPLSLFLVTVAPTGERKSSADYYAALPVKKYEQRLRDIYTTELPDYRHAKRAYDVALANTEKKCKGDRYEIELALKAIGDEPKAPLLPHLICDEPSLEGLHKLYERGQPSLAIFSDEGGGFLGGHALKAENRLRTFAGLSHLWDGATIRRTRAGDGAISLIGRRLAINLLIQPQASQQLLSDPCAKDQGLLSRILVSGPAALAGTRMQKVKSVKNDDALRHYELAVTKLLEKPVNLVPRSNNALAPRELIFDPKAETLWLRLADEIEVKLGDGCAYEAIRGFGNKLAEHIARLAGVLTLVENPDADQIDCETLGRAAMLGDFFASEAIRLFENGLASAEIIEAEKLLTWLKLWPEEQISLAAIYQRGPNSIRDKASALRAVKILEDHGWLSKVEGGNHTVAGKSVRDAWRISRQEA